MAFALTGARVFTGEHFLDGHAVVISGRHIAQVVPRQALGAMRTVDLHGGVLAPGFIDVQVNGGGGALLNDHPSVATVRTIASSHRKFGTTGMLPTVITDAPEVLLEAAAALRKAREEHVPGILGIHLEGPFLDPARKGAHDPRFIRAMTEADADRIAGLDCGVVMITLAPNRVAPALIGKLAMRGVRVSLGHADARYAEIRAALDAGACAFTHLYNAMSQLTGREPGMAGTALSDEDSFAGLICDGHHVHDAALRIALAIKRDDRLMLITDAMPSAADGPSSFKLQERSVTAVNGRLELADGTLAGSNLTMDAAVRFCVENLGVDLARALRMASLAPATFIRKDRELGRIVPGALASLVHLDDSLHVTQTWIDGEADCS